MSEYARYKKHLLLDEISLLGQKQLLESKVLIVGLGALGSLQASLLSRAGLGYLRIVDGDDLDLTNLQRQILYDEDDLKFIDKKAHIALAKLRRINSEISIEAIAEKLNLDNAKELISDVDLVLDATDNFKTRYVINKVCVELKKPWIYTGVSAFVGMSMNILPEQGACFECLDKNIRDKTEDNGVFNAASSLISSIAVSEAIKILSNNKNLKHSRLLIMDLLHNEFKEIIVKKSKNCICSN